MYTIDALEEIEKSRDYEFALMTTFNIDVDFFERQIVGRLIGNGIKKIALFVDAQELSKSINNTWKKSLLMGNRYSVNPVRINGSFHPKVLLLMSFDSAKLIVSSANYTKSSYSTNNEIFNVFEMNPENREYLHLIQAAVDFFRSVYDISYRLDDEIFKEIEEIPYISMEHAFSNEAFLLHSIDNTILSQIEKRIGNMSSVDIAVPFYDNNLNAVTGIMSAFPGAMINCYVQNHKCRFNVEKANGIESLIIKPFNGFMEPKSQSFYHGKVLRFKTDTDSWILYGSANCTGAALQSVVRGGGNVECSILEKGATHEFDYFFDNMCQTDPSEDVVCDLLDYQSEDGIGKYFFKYGVVSENTITLHIGITGSYGEPDIKCFDESLELEFDAKNKTILVYIPRETLLNSEELISLKVTDATGEYMLKGWLMNPLALDSYRKTETNSGEFQYYSDPEGDERIDNILRVLQNLALGYESMKRKQDVERIVENKEKAELLPDIDYEDAPEGIIDYVIPPRIPTSEEYIEYKNYKKAERIARGIISAFLNRNSIERQQKIDKYKQTKKDPKRSACGRRKPSLAEQQGKRLISAAIKKMCDDENINNDTTEHFLQGFCQIADAMSQYSSTFVENMFDPGFIVDKRCELLAGALKLNDSFTEEHIKVLIQLAVETHYIEQKITGSHVSDRFDVEELIRGIDEKLGIRDVAESFITDETTLQIGDHIEDVFYEPDQYGKIDGVRPSRKEIIKYLDTAFGYRTRTQIDELVYSRFGETAIISTENRVFLVSCLARLRDWFDGDGWLMSEIDNYCRHYSVPVDSIVLDIRGIQIPDGPDPAIRVVFSKDVGSYHIRRSEYHKSGIVIGPEGKALSRGSDINNDKQSNRITEVKIGDTVKHNKYGEAEVINIVDKKDGKVIIELLFKDGSRKKIGKEYLIK